MKFSFDKAAKPRSKRVWYSQREIAYCYKYRKGKLKRALKSAKLEKNFDDTESDYFSAKYYPLENISLANR